MKAIKIFLICFFIILAGIGAWIGYEYHRFVRLPAGSGDTPVIVEIPADETFNAMARRLKAAGVISNVFRFKALARFKDADKRLRAGEYRLTTAMTPLQVLDALVNGDVVLHRLTVPEGFTIREIAQELGRTGLADGGAFVALGMNARLAAEFNLPGRTLEGYLFPDTYFFPKGVAPRAIINQMVRRFKEQFPDAWRQRAQQLKMSVHEVVTLASIIEKETGDSAERPVIASVFHNRLKKRMRLESDPTVIYGLEDFDGNITRRHLSMPTPYNTYVIKRLPPGPIANPGRLAIQAALYPAETGYLFFVSKKDGTHYFSKTMKEHNQAIRKYQLRRRKSES